MLQQRLEAVEAGRDAAEARARHLERLNGGLEADLSAALAARDSALDVWAQALSCSDRCESDQSCDYWEVVVHVMMIGKHLVGVHRQVMDVMYTNRAGNELRSINDTIARRNVIIHRI